MKEWNAVAAMEKDKRMKVVDSIVQHVTLTEEEFLLIGRRKNGHAKYLCE